ncbi:MAG: amidohydrolase family protein [Alphaproteobacteria bacterium]
MQTIDVHTHYYPDGVVRLIDEEGGPFGATVARDDARGPTIKVRHPPSGPIPPAGPLIPTFRDLDARLADMDAHGVDVHLMSFSQPMLYWASDDLGLRLAGAFNDAVAEAHLAHPRRFFGLMALPMQNPALAAEEFDRAAALPGMRGVFLSTRVVTTELSDPIYWPLLERIAASGLPAFVHPLNAIGAGRLGSRHYFANLLANPFETTACAALLIFDGVLDRFPGLELVLAHAGGALPWLIGRLTQGWHVRPECRHLVRSPREYLDRFHFDTITFDHTALAHLAGLVGTGRLLLGSDYCFSMSELDPVGFVLGAPGLDDAGRAAILGGNARALFRLPSE